MRRFAPVVVVVLFLAGCGRTAVPDASGSIFGSVTAGPTCPVERVGSPCPPAPWTGTVRATDEAGRRTETQTDARGSYTLRLAPGSYVVIAVPTGGPQTATPVTVDVREGSPERVDLTVDTGIR